MPLRRSRQHGGVVSEIGTFATTGARFCAKATYPMDDSYPMDETRLKCWENMDEWSIRTETPESSLASTGGI